VTATLALVLAIAGGTAYAVDKIHSRDIANNSVKSADLKNRKGVKGKDVRPNSLRGQQIVERTLQAGSIAHIAGEQASSCVPQSTPRNCIATTISVSRPSNLLVLTTGNQESLGGPAHASCRISIDGVQEALTVNPGENITDNTDITATNGFARTFLSTDPVGPGQHAVALRCVRLGGQVRINEPTIAAIAIAAG
jgi:hypothetical protein